MVAPINPTQLTPPRVAFLDERTGAISREWFRFFLSLLTATQTNQTDVDVSPDANSLLAAFDASLASVAQDAAVTPSSLSETLESSFNAAQNAFQITPPDLGGTVTSVAASGGTTGLTFSGSPITTSGTFTLGGTLGVGNGGTGQTSYTNGQLLIGNTTGNTLTKATLTAGTNVSITNGPGSITINATDQFVGTVTSVSVVSANGFAGSVANATTTPAITLTTTASGVLKGDGTAISAASAGTDYVAPGVITTSGLTMATARLLGRTTASTGAVEEITVGTGLSLSAGSLTNAAPDQTVTLTGGTGISISGSYPSFTITNTLPDQIVSLTGAGTTVVTGTYPSFTITSNDQFVGTVTSVSGTGTVNGITLTGTVTNSGNLTLGGTLSNVSLTTQVTGTLPIANGGTGATTAAGALTSLGAYPASNPNGYTSNTGTVTSVSGTGTVNGITLTGTVTSSGSLTLGGTLSGVSLTTQVTGTLPVGNGGTGTATAFTAGSVVFAGASGVYAQDNSNLFWDDTNNRLGVGTSGPGRTIDIVGPTLAPGTQSSYALGVANSGGGANGDLTFGSNGSSAYIQSWAGKTLFLNSQGNGIVTGSVTVTTPGVYVTTVGATNRDVFVDSTGLLGYVASIRASKTNIADLDSTSWLYDLHPVSFNYRKRDEDGEYTDEAETPLEYGLIAEEVEVVNANMVFYDETEDGLELRGVSYSKLVVPMLKELQMLRARVAKLEGL